jgi:hypothetical protein
MSLNASPWAGSNVVLSGTLSLGTSVGNSIRYKGLAMISAARWSKTSIRSLLPPNYVFLLTLRLVLRLSGHSSPHVPLLPV